MTANERRGIHRSIANDKLNGLELFFFYDESVMFESDMVSYYERNGESMQQQQ